MTAPSSPQGLLDRFTETTEERLGHDAGHAVHWNLKLAVLLLAGLGTYLLLWLFGARASWYGWLVMSFHAMLVVAHMSKLVRESVSAEIEGWADLYVRVRWKLQDKDARPATVEPLPTCERCVACGGCPYPRGVQPSESDGPLSLVRHAGQQPPRQLEVGGGDDRDVTVSGSGSGSETTGVAAASPPCAEAPVLSRRRAVRRPFAKRLGRQK